MARARQVKGVVVVQRVFVDAPVNLAQQLHVGEDFEVGVLINVVDAYEAAAHAPRVAGFQDASEMTITAARTLRAVVQPARGALIVLG